jgi:hypothetical protein
MSIDSSDKNMFKAIEGNVINELSGLFESYYNESKKREKERLKKNIEYIIQHSKIFLQAGSSFKKAIDTYNPFSINNVAQFYNPKLMHGVEAFNVVIGNPPYVSTKGIDLVIKKELEKNFGFADDLYSHFYFKGLELCANGGILSYITSKTFWTIQSKKNLRELLLNNNLIDIYDTDNPFESAMVDTCVVLVQKEHCSNGMVNFLKSEGDYSRPVKCEVEKKFYSNAANKVIFNPTKENIEIYEKYNSKVLALMSNWWQMISTSKNISKNIQLLEKYRNGLKPGDITLLGLITDGGQGLATANNGKYVGVLETTKEAKRIKDARIVKFTDFMLSKKITKYGSDKNMIRDTIERMSEKQIRELFDSLKNDHGRDIFGQGFLYRIVSLEEIKDINAMTDAEKSDGLAGLRTFVPYDKGDKDGNRWFLRTPYYIDWNSDNVNFLKNDPRARYQGYQFYFRAGFCWSDIHTLLIKTRLKMQSVHDIKSMSLFSINSICSDKYLVSLLNSTFISNYDFSFVNGTQTFQINDARQLPIIIPNSNQLSEFEDVFDRAFAVKNNQFDGKISNSAADKILQEIQVELDKKVSILYGLEVK